MLREWNKSCTEPRILQMPSLPWAPQHNRNIWEESRSYKLTFKNSMTYILWNWEVYHGPTCLRAQRNQALPRGLIWGLGRTKSKHLNAGQGWPHTCDEFILSMRDMTYPNKSQPLESLVWVNHLQESTYHMHKGYLVADGLWASIYICKNPRIFFHSEHWGTRQEGEFWVGRNYGE